MPSFTGFTLSAVWSLSFAVCVALNALSATGFVGVPPGDQSDANPTLLTPAGYAFSIWSLIYAWLLALVVYSWLPAGRRDVALQSGIGAWLPLNFALNAAWIVLFGFSRYWLALVDIAAMLGTLLVALYRVDARLTPTAPRRNVVFYVVTLPALSVYAGWLTVATLLNALVCVGRLDRNVVNAAPTGVVLSVVCQTVAALAALAMLVTTRNVFYAAVPAWALVAVAVKHAHETPSVATSALALAGVDVVACVATVGAVAWSVWRQRDNQIDDDDDDDNDVVRSPSRRRRRQRQRSSFHSNRHARSTR